MESHSRQCTSLLGILIDLFSPSVLLASLQESSGCVCDLYFTFPLSSFILCPGAASSQGGWWRKFSLPPGYSLFITGYLAWWPLEGKSCWNILVICITVFKSWNLVLNYSKHVMLIIESRLKLAKSNLISFQFYFCLICIDFCGSSTGKESVCNVGDLGLIPGSWRSPGEGKGYPLQYSGLENSMDYSPWGCKKSDRTKQLSLNFDIYIYRSYCQIFLVIS